MTIIENMRPEFWDSVREHLRVYGRRVKIPSARLSGRWWYVQAASERYVVLTAAVPFHPAGTRAYTIIDWKKAINGPCNQLGNGWGDGTYTKEQCEALLAELDAGRLQVSRRNQMDLVIGDIERRVTS